MAIFSRATTRGDWTGEWDQDAVTQLLLRMDSFIGSSSTRPTPDSSGRGRTANALNFVESSVDTTRWGSGITLNRSGIASKSSLKVTNEGSLFPSSGKLMVGSWVKFENLHTWNPLFSTRNTPGKHPLFHVAVYNSSGSYEPVFRFYNETGVQIVDTYIPGISMSTGVWYWVGFDMDLTLGSYTLYCIPLTGQGYSRSGSVSGLNTSCTADLDVGYGPDPYYSSATFDEVVVSAPSTVDPLPWALRSRLADGAVASVQADTTTVVGRISPASGAVLPVVSNSRAMPANWGTDEPMLTVNGTGVSLRYRTSNNLTSWSAWKNVSSLKTEPSSAWIQYEITLSEETSYLDEILLSTAPPPTPPLPSTRDVQPFSLDPLLVVPDGGGVFLQETLLSCVTLDTSSNESTLTFSISMRDPRSASIEPEMPVKFKGRHYVARGITSKRSGNSGYIEVYCERLWYDLIYAGQIDSQSWSSDAQGVMANVLSGTDWHVGTVEGTAVLNWDSDSSTVLGMLKQVSSLYGGDLVFDDENKFVHLLNKGGRDRGTYFTYEHGIEHASRVIDTTTLVTRIYGRNAEGMTIAPANGGVDYVENFTWTDEIRSSVYDFRSGMTPHAMMNFLVPFLALRSTPNLSYEYSVSGLSNRLQEVDRFEVLDTVFVMDEDFGQSVKNRIVSLSIDWVDLRNSVITLSNSLRTLASSDESSDPGELSTGQNIDTRDINPFNLLINSRGDNGMAHWAGSQVQVVEGGETGRYSFAFGAGGGSLEQTVASDNRESFVFSAAVDSPSDSNMSIEVTFQYVDGTSETQILEL